MSNEQEKGKMFEKEIAEVEKEIEGKIHNYKFMAVNRNWHLNVFDWMEKLTPFEDYLRLRTKLETLQSCQKKFDDFVKRIEEELDNIYFTDKKYLNKNYVYMVKLRIDNAVKELEEKND